MIPHCYICAKTQQNLERMATLVSWQKNWICTTCLMNQATGLSPLKTQIFGAHLIKCDFCEMHFSRIEVKEQHIRLMHPFPRK